MTPSLRRGLRLISLWVVWLLAMLFHVDLGLMPLFSGTVARKPQPCAQCNSPLAVRGDAGLFPVASDRDSSHRLRLHFRSGRATLARLAATDSRQRLRTIREVSLCC
jgi:hypothetical protein